MKNKKVFVVLAVVACLGVGFWLFGIPAGLVLAFPLGYGAEGLWMGLVIALGAMAILLLLRVRILFARDLKRLHY